MYHHGFEKQPASSQLLTYVSIVVPIHELLVSMSLPSLACALV